jgi:hypothetical protein
MEKCLQSFFDITARKPSGWLGKIMYRNPVRHYGFFRVTIEKLQLEAEDVFLQVGCGGGVLLEMALQTVDELASTLKGAGFQTVQVQRLDRSKHTNFAHQLACAVK